MGSRRWSAAGQDPLPIDLPTAGPNGVERPRSRDAPAVDRGRYRLHDDALASYGWPAGTEIVVDPGRRPRRGEVALAREGSRLRIGVLEVEFGRAVLRTDRGSALLGAAARFVGVVTVAGAPLDGMPDAPSPRQ